MKSYLHYASGFFDNFGIKHLMNNQNKVVHQATKAALGTEHWPVHKVKRVRKPASWSRKNKVVSRLRKPGLLESNPWQRKRPSFSNLTWRLIRTVSNSNSCEYKPVLQSPVVTGMLWTCILLKNLWRIHQRTPNTNTYKCDYRKKCPLTLDSGFCTPSQRLQFCYNRAKWFSLHWLLVVFWKTLNWWQKAKIRNIKRWIVSKQGWKKISCRSSF